MDRLDFQNLSEEEKVVFKCIKRRQVRDCKSCCRYNRCEDYLLFKNKKSKKSS